jgi:hypothetical protein
MRVAPLPPYWKRLVRIIARHPYRNLMRDQGLKQRYHAASAAEAMLCAPFMRQDEQIARRHRQRRPDVGGSQPEPR